MAKHEDEPKKTVYRSSEDGQFVSRRYAETHKTTTERERVDVGARPPEPPKKK